MQNYIHFHIYVTKDFVDDFKQFTRIDEELTGENKNYRLKYNFSKDGNTLEVDIFSSTDRFLYGFILPNLGSGEIEGMDFEVNVPKDKPEIAFFWFDLLSEFGMVNIVEGRPSVFLILPNAIKPSKIDFSPYKNEPKDLIDLLRVYAISTQNDDLKYYFSSNEEGERQTGRNDLTKGEYLVLTTNTIYAFRKLPHQAPNIELNAKQRT